jgi:hypothetical protein
MNDPESGGDQSPQLAAAASWRAGALKHFAIRYAATRVSLKGGAAP